MDENNLLKHIQDYYVSIESAEKINYKKSKEVLGDLLDAHCLAVATMQKIITSHILEPGNTSEKISEELLQISIFYQGVSECEKVIRNGQYNMAAALVRQEYEIICNLNEIKGKNRKPGKAPNAKSGLENFGKQYSNLSKLTHVVSENEWDYIYKKAEKYYPDTIKPVTLTPVVDSDVCIDLYGKHVLFICTIILKISELFSEMYGVEQLEEDDKNNLSIITKMLIDYKIIIPNKKE